MGVTGEARGIGKSMLARDRLGTPVVHELMAWIGAFVNSQIRNRRLARSVSDWLLSAATLKTSGEPSGEPDPPQEAAGRTGIHA